MEKNGEEVAVLSYGRDGELNRYGTEMGLAFLRNRSEMVSHFLAFVGGKFVLFDAELIFFRVNYLAH